MSPWTGQGWEQLLLCPRGMTLLPTSVQGHPGLCSCHWGTKQESPPGEMEPRITKMAFICHVLIWQVPGLLKSFSAHSWRNPRWGCRFFLASQMLFRGWATPVSNGEVNWEQWHLQTLGIPPCCKARPWHLDGISLLASTSQKNHFNRSSLIFMRAKYSLAPQKLPSVQWVNNMWLILWHMAWINPSPCLTLIFLWILRYILKQSWKFRRFRKCQMMDLGHTAFFYNNHNIQR